MALTEYACIKTGAIVHVVRSSEPLTQLRDKYAWYDDIKPFKECTSDQRRNYEMWKEQ